jgi:hypothetical protein
MEEPLRAYLLKRLAPVAAGTRVNYAAVALHDPAETDLVVYVSGPQWCGTGGCPLLVLAPSRSTYRLVSKTLITRPPIRALNTRSHGWRDIGVQVSGGGIVRPYEARLRFNGSRYPSNPTVAPATPSKGAPGHLLISADDQGDVLAQGLQRPSC